MTIPPLPDRPPDAFDAPETVAAARFAICRALYGDCYCQKIGPTGLPVDQDCALAQDAAVCVLTKLRTILQS